MASLVVAATSEEEEQQIREDILTRANLLQRYGLHEDAVADPSYSGQAAGGPEASASGQLPSTGSAAEPAPGQVHRPGDQPAPTPAGAACENVEFYIVVRQELRRLEALASSAGAPGAGASAPMFDEQALERLLDVPEELCCPSAAGLSEELAVIDSFTHPLLCAQLRDFIGGESDEALESEREGAAKTSSSSDDASDESDSSEVRGAGQRGGPRKAQL
mmetsp:Transcript_65391/g.174239  ORF Transcript_65391/g.174239 Transcript_65391/m.174239 type:complete len:219 (-) Transcript_65391:195-851(-)